MQKESFVNYVSERLQDITGCEVRVHEVPKNNGLVLTGLTIVRENRNAYPTIYLDNYYEDYQAGRDMESIVREIKRTDENIKLQMILMSLALQTLTGSKPTYIIKL